MDSHDTSDHEVLFRAARIASISAESQVYVWAHSTGSGLVYVVSHDRVAKTQLETTARGITDVVPGRPLRLLVSHFSWGTLSIPKGMIIGRDAVVPGLLLDLTPPLEMDEDTPTIHLVHYKPAISKEVQMETARDVTRADYDCLQVHWEESVILPTEYNSYRQPILDMLGHFSDMWDGHLGRIEAARDWIQLTSSDVRPITRQRTSPVLRHAYSRRKN